MLLPQASESEHLILGFPEDSLHRLSNGIYSFSTNEKLLFFNYLNLVCAYACVYVFGQRTTFSGQIKVVWLVQQVSLPAEPSLQPRN